MGQTRTLGVAFFHGTGGRWYHRLFSWIVRQWTGGRYSHVELIFDDGRWFSSSERDGGTRFKQLTPDENWDVVWLKVTSEQYSRIRAFCEQQLHREYDWLGIIGMAIAPVGGHPDQWFCSEICTAALAAGGIFSGAWPEKTHPNRLYTMVNELCADYFDQSPK